MLRTVHTLADLAFDVILSNSFAATPVAWVESDPAYRQAMVAELAASLST
jgi:hypothetical protein